MRNRVESIFGMVVVAVLTAAPAFAVTPVQVPEPATMSLLAAGGAGAIGVHFVRKFFKRK